MEDRLSARAAVELHDLDTVRLQLLNDAAGKLLGRLHQRAKSLRIDLENVAGDAMLWNDQRVAARLRKQIQKGENFVVFINLVAWCIAAQDLGEYIIMIIFSVQTQCFASEFSRLHRSDGASKRLRRLDARVAQAVTLLISYSILQTA